VLYYECVHSLSVCSAIWNQTSQSSQYCIHSLSSSFQGLSKHLTSEQIIWIDRAQSDHTSRDRNSISQIVSSLDLSQTVWMLLLRTMVFTYPRCLHTLRQYISQWQTDLSWYLAFRRTPCRHCLDIRGSPSCRLLHRGFLAFPRILSEFQLPSQHSDRWEVAKHARAQFLKDQQWARISDEKGKALNQVREALPSGQHQWYYQLLLQDPRLFPG